MIACHTRALGALSDALAAFLRSRSARLLSVSVADDDLRSATLEIVRAHELHPACGRGVIVLESPFDAKAPGWDERAAELRAHHALRVEVMARAGDTLAALGPTPAARDVRQSPPRGIEGFGATLGQLLRTVAPPLDGWILVLAPTRISDPAGFQDAVRILFAAKGLEELRWITVEPGEAVTRDLVASLGDRAAIHRVAVDPAERDRQWEELLRAMAAAPAGAPAGVVAGGAWPKGVLPPRRKESVPVNLEAGEGPLSPADAARLRALVLGAALAARRDDGREEAISSQREASALCLSRGLAREGSVLAITLGTYHLRYREEEPALEIFRDVAARCGAAEHHDVAAAALLASAAIHRTKDRPEVALEHYRAAADHAKKADGPQLTAIESLRTTGEVALELGKSDIAFEALRDAVAIAERRPPAEIRVSSAGEAARLLAARYREVGRSAEADALLDQANRFETGARAASQE